MIISLKILAKLPLSILYKLSDIFAWVIYNVVRYRKDIVFNNLHNAFPEKNEKDIKRIAKACYKNIADVVIEAIKSSNLSILELNRRVHFVNVEILDPLIKAKQSFLLLAAHQCNWEWLLLTSKNQLGIDVAAIYRPLHNKKYDKLMLESRSQYGVTLIPSKRAIMELMRRRNSLQAIATIADQPPLEGDEKCWVKCLNQDTAFPVGVDKIAKIMKLPAFFIYMRRTKRGFYEVKLEQLANPPYTKEGYPIAQSYAKAFEKQILMFPNDWIWTNRKWKYRKPIYE